MATQDGVHYATARAFNRALSDRITNAASSSQHGVAELRRQFAYGRLLARVFSFQPERWVLKGATGLLARIPDQARHSIDVDLYFDGEIAAALDALREAVEVDLGDFFTFDIERGASFTGVTAGSQLRAVAYLGDNVFEIFRVDVVVEQTMTADPESTSPIEPVDIPGLHSVPYRTYPIQDHIADKHAAMVDTYAGQPSTRYRDLVDLVLIARTQTVEAGSLHTALVSEHRRRGTSPGTVNTLPSEEWHDGYRKLAVEVPGFSFIDAADALEIVNKLVGPVFGGLTVGIWDPATLKWTAP
ncbi:MAG: nucleotidyl transferase AbiEii/AbiGii toxin family protein [Actinobacteria bacterium]|jgi:hypothetical protein|nr:nucleotidyl transferase AbiEii/AbiGii toxin family protein [Actinomycetota bacterium]